MFVYNVEIITCSGGLAAFNYRGDYKYKEENVQ